MNFLKNNNPNPIILIDIPLTTDANCIPVIKFVALTVVLAEMVDASWILVCRVAKLLTTQESIDPNCI